MSEVTQSGLDSDVSGFSPSAAGCASPIGGAGAGLLIPGAAAAMVREAASCAADVGGVRYDASGVHLCGEAPGGAVSCGVLEEHCTAMMGVTLQRFSNVEVRLSGLEQHIMSVNSSLAMLVSTLESSKIVPLVAKHKEFYDKFDRLEGLVFEKLHDLSASLDKDTMAEDLAQDLGKSLESRLHGAVALSEEQVKIFHTKFDSLDVRLEELSGEQSLLRDALERVWLAEPQAAGCKHEEGEDGVAPFESVVIDHFETVRRAMQIQQSQLAEVGQVLRGLSERVHGPVPETEDVLHSGLPTPAPSAHRCSEKRQQDTECGGGPPAAGDSGAGKRCDREEEFGGGAASFEGVD